MFFLKRLVSSANMSAARNIVNSQTKSPRKPKSDFVIPTLRHLKEKYPNVFFGCFGNPMNHPCDHCNEGGEKNTEAYIKLCEEYQSGKLNIDKHLKNGLKVFSLK